MCDSCSMVKDFMKPKRQRVSICKTEIRLTFWSNKSEDIDDILSYCIFKKTETDHTTIKTNLKNW